MTVIRRRAVARLGILGVALIASLGLAACSQGTGTELSTSTEETSTTESRPPRTTTTTTTTTTTSTTTTTTTTTLPPPPPPPPAPEVFVPPPPPAPLANDCNPNYSGCVPNASDVDCAGGSGDGPAYSGTVQVIGADVYGLDADHDGVGCE